MGHGYFGHGYSGHDYIGHDYIGHDCLRPLLYRSKPLFALSTSIFWVRILQKLQISKTLGPILHTVGQMASDLANFAIMLCVFFGAFMVAITIYAITT